MAQVRTRLALLLLTLLLVLPAGRCSPADWQRQSRQLAELERESGQYASQLFNGRPLDGRSHQEADLFRCVEPSRQLFDNFVRQYNRSFHDEGAEKLDRLNLFASSLRRTIVLNRIVQNEILNASNYELKPEIRNYHFIAPISGDNVALWYADVTDCELGLIKYILFDIFYLLDKNELALAYKLAVDNSEHLPLLAADGFEQLANILLVRLYDRFRGDAKMNQLFQWPLYLKKLAGYAYNRRQAQQADFRSKLPLVAFAYPAYFKDIKYNAPAANRTGDNLAAHLEHERFNKLRNRRFSSRQERNKRLAIFRQRWTLINLLNDEEGARNATPLPEWARAQQAGTFGLSERLRAVADEAASEKRFASTQFSDLTDAEFVAYLTNDFSLLDSKESASFIDANFPIRSLDDGFRRELAAELELRRMAHQWADAKQEGGAERVREAVGLARRTIDELISDVGLPVGAAAVEGISEEEHLAAFSKVAGFFRKSYWAAGRSAASPLGPSENELSDEQQRRYREFKLNYGRFKAWTIKEGWQLDEKQQVAMLRLADMSWQEIKLALFKLCCLTRENLAALSGANATIQYLGSHAFLCKQLGDTDELQSGVSPDSGEQERQARELAALEIYYYYTVHFNKHHTDLQSFNARFAIFRRNIDQIRRHSCTRGLTLFRSLLQKQLETMSTIDVLDPRRSYTDDLNLDRYEYFTVPNLSAPERTQRPEFERLRSGGGSQPSRAGISYRREIFFSSLLQEGPQPTLSAPESAYVVRLSNAARDTSLHAERYRSNAVARIYELVVQRYKYCMRTVRNIELGASELLQQCQSAGPLGDQSATNFLSDNQLSPAESQRLQQHDPCAFYRLGLEPWAEGLIRQEPESARLIQSAKC